MAMDATTVSGGNYSSARVVEMKSNLVKNTSQIGSPEIEEKVSASTPIKVEPRKRESVSQVEKEDKALQVFEKRTDQERDKLKKMVEQINKQFPDSEAIFGIHDQTNRVTIKIVNKETKEVIKEYPPEQMLDMIAKAWELAGLTVDEKR